VRPVASALAVVFVAATIVVAAQQAQEGFRFRSGVELVSVTATVTDNRGRFVSGLRKEDFLVYEDGRLQEVTHFSNERVPVSLGIVLDTSGSMTPDKMMSARAAIGRLAHELLDEEDELFLMEFSDRATLVQDWTTDRRAISVAVRRMSGSGGTALYDAVASALPHAEAGRHPKKALLVISDGNDTDSITGVAELRHLIRESEVLVYALGVDGTSSREGIVVAPPVQLPIPLPFPIPGGRRPQPRIPRGGGSWARGERVNAEALRQITDDTGGRTEIVRGFENLDAATARIADELSKQYYLGFVSSANRDGRWHSIRVEVRDRRLNVRARRGYVAS
jgi:Ca-activated chloride channel family protein